MVRLRVESAGKTREVETDETVLTIGRTSRNTLEIHDDQSSREHCRLERCDDGSWTLTDLASRNGTLLNDQPIGQAPLRHGDLIRIGTTTIRFELPQAERAATEAAEAEREAAQEAGEQTPEAIKLVLATGPSRGKAVVVAGKLTTIGRRPNNDIVLAGRGVSNRHAEIRRGPDGFVLVDEGSRNGTFLNGRLVLRAPIRPGDEIQIGRTTIRVFAGDAETTGAIALETEGIVRDESGFITAEEPEKPARPWARVALAAAGVLVLVAGALVALQGRLTRGTRPAADLLGGRGEFASRAARRAWTPEPSADASFERGALVLRLPSSGSSGALARCALSDPLPVKADRRYTVTGRIRPDGLVSGLAGIVATWTGEADWSPSASMLLRPEARADGEWGTIEEALRPPPWAGSLVVSCAAAGTSGRVAFDDIRIADAPETGDRTELVTGPLRLVMDTPVLFSLTHGERVVTAGAGVAVEPQQGSAVRQMRAQVASGYPETGEGRHHVRSRAAGLPGEVELLIEQTMTYRQGSVRLEYRLWTAKPVPVVFAGIELPCAAGVLSRGVDVRTAGGFAEAGRDETSFAFDGADVVTLHLDTGSASLAFEEPVTVAGRREGGRGVLRLGRRDGSLGPQALVVAFVLRGTTGEEERKVVSRLVAAERAASQGHYGEAIRRYEEIARLYRDRRMASETARQQLARLHGQAALRLEAALRLLARAELTGEREDFVAARQALEPLAAGLDGTAYAAKMAEGVARCGDEQERAARQRDEQAAQRLLRAARAHTERKQPHIARLTCRELLARYPDAPAAADAKALLETLDAPPRAPGPAPEPPDDAGGAAPRPPAPGAGRDDAGKDRPREPEPPRDGASPTPR